MYNKQIHDVFMSPISKLNHNHFHSKQHNNLSTLSILSKRSDYNIVRIVADHTKSQQLCVIENNTTKPANLPVTQLTNLERLYNSRIQLQPAAAAMVWLVNRLNNKCTQLS